jgi:hypothetical protein
VAGSRVAVKTDNASPAIISVAAVANRTIRKQLKGAAHQEAIRMVRRA